MARRLIFECKCPWHHCSIRTDQYEHPAGCIYGISPEYVYWKKKNKVTQERIA